MIYVFEGRAAKARGKKRSTLDILTSSARRKHEFDHAYSVAIYEDFRYQSGKQRKIIRRL